MRLIASVLIALFSSALIAGDPYSAVVLVNGCSGVCVDPDGLVMTAKHCDLPEEVTVTFPSGREATAVRVYECPETEGPVVYLCDGNEDFPYLEIAGGPSMLGDCVWTYGYPDQRNQPRKLTWASGRLLRVNEFTYRGGKFIGNVVGCRTAPGWSGGPLLDAHGEVIGLLNSGDAKTSVFISYAAVCRAYAAAAKVEILQHELDEQTLYVFTWKVCGPCKQFKRDLQSDESFQKAIGNLFQIEYIDIEQQPKLARQYDIADVPVFMTSDKRVVGYTGTDDLLASLGLTREQKPEPQPDPVKPQPAVAQVQQPEPEEPAAEATVPETPAVEKPAVSPADDRIERLTKVVNSASTIATWLGVTGATGGVGGLVMGGFALYRTLRKVRHPQGRAPPVITVDSPPPPQAIVTETQFAPYEKDTFAQAFSWAESEMARKYPGSVGTMESIRGLIDQYLAAKNIKPTRKSTNS